ncbi:hypothetical protein ABIA33_002215 [Streptacidiphilus sp. MAP12-16]
MIAVAVGFLALRAALSATPGKAKGLDATLRSFALTSFGLYSFAEARWRRTLGGVPR